MHFQICGNNDGNRDTAQFNENAINNTIFFVFMCYLYAETDFGVRVYDTHVFDVRAYAVSACI